MHSIVLGTITANTAHFDVSMLAISKNFTFDCHGQGSAR